MLYDVMIYDMSAGFENANILVSDSAKIKSTADEKHMILSMFYGEQFSNLTDQQVKKKNVPYRRETFSRKDVLIEMDGGFEMKDGSFFKGNAASKNIKELEIAIDSLGTANDSIGLDNWNNVKRTTYKVSNTFNADDSTYKKKNNLYRINVDSIYNVATRHSKLLWKRSELNKIKQLNTDYDIKRSVIRSLDKDLNKHKITWWEKFTLSLGCLVFFFIGAPLGAIVRKGGLGYPVLISVATFILYYIFNTSGSKMAREGEWEIWYGAWLSTIILAPLGVFFTYQSNKDSGIFNSDSIKAFFRMLFAIPEKRHVTLKEVIIEDPDYEKDCRVLKELNKDAVEYEKVNDLKKLPGIKQVFINENNDTLEIINDKMENLVEEMSNSKNKKVIIQLNEFPVLSTNAITSPFSRRWLNVLSLVLFPIGIIIYLRALKFRRRLVKDLEKIELNTKKMIDILIKEKLVNNG
jgi:lipopolysaccharide export system permease protein